jgi:hypothetical protein
MRARLLCAVAVLSGASVASAAEPPSAEQTAPATTAPPAAGVPPSTAPGSVPASPYGPAPPPYEPPAPPPPQRSMTGTSSPATLLDAAGDYAIGGFGGISVMYTRFVGTNAAQVCGEGAVILDHALTFGGGGCGVVTMVDAQGYGDLPHDPSDRLMFGYGGAIIRYHFRSREMVNVAAGALIGAGGLSIGPYDTQTDPGQTVQPKSSEAVFVFEPQIGAYLNVTRFLRLGVNGGYRIASSVKTKGLSAADISGPSLGGSIQLGWF